MLRIDPGLHALLRQAAQEAGLSLNEYCGRKLAAPAASPELEPARAVVSRAAARFGDSLVAVAAFGSWARDELTAASDVDLLLVLEPHVALTRRLYRDWDSSPLAWEGRPVEPHFVHLPPPEEPAGGLWAEVAIDGVVLFERRLVLSTCLARVRRDIVAGRLVKRVTHGHPYWVAA